MSSLAQDPYGRHSEFVNKVCWSKASAILVLLTFHATIWYEGANSSGLMSVYEYREVVEVKGDYNASDFDVLLMSVNYYE